MTALPRIGILSVGNVPMVEWCPRHQKCTACGEEFAVRDFELACPKCGSPQTTCISGTELDTAYLEMEEPCAKS